MALGALLTFSYAPFGLWWWPIVSLTGLFYLLHQPGTVSKTLTAWWFGLGWFGAGISWVHVSLADFGGIPLIASVAMMFLLCSYLALYPALAVYIAHRFFKASHWALVLPLLWVVTEWLRSWVLTGFPWLSVGYSQLHSPLGGWLPVVGETGVSALLILMSSGMAYALHQRHWVSCWLLLIVFPFAGSVLNSVEWSKPNGQTLRTAMVQGNIQQALRWVPEQDAPTMQTYASETTPYLGHDLIVWPEAAIPKLESLALDYLHELDTVTANAGSALITGIVNYNFENEQVFNNLIVVGRKQPGDENGHYRYFHNNRFDKHHLLPIGEFVPFERWLRRLAPIFDLPMSSFTRGDFQQRNLIANGIAIAPAICFEIAFPRQVRANLYNDTQVMLTVSNDAWFGRSHGPAQHMEIAQVRAKEFGLPLIRSTNNGISAFVDHRGEQTLALPQFELASASYTIPLVSGTTPYRRFGDLPIWIVTSLFALSAFLLRKRSAR
ncbi:apolipoprotein N-acyltransferase [Alteromonas sp. SM 2104]|nr:apolipoprotein N-acyltransferase [Alteromonas oceanisediminis]